MKTKIILTIGIILVSLNLFPQEKDSIFSKFIKSNFKEKIYELENKKLPSFELLTLSGNNITSQSLIGKPTLINFWFTNCTPCIEEMPILNEIKNEFNGKVNFISITFENEKDINVFLEKNTFDFTHIINSKSYINDLGIMTYPKTMVLDQDLMVRYIVGKKPKGSENDEQDKSIFMKNIKEQLSKFLNP